MSFVPNTTPKNCFSPCPPDVVKSGGCSCNNLSRASNKVFKISSRIYKIKYILSDVETFKCQK